MLYHEFLRQLQNMVYHEVLRWSQNMIYSEFHDHEGTKYVITLVSARVTKYVIS